MNAIPLQAESTTPLYTGGNEVFFSFLQVLMRGVDRGVVDAKALDTVFRDWGATLARQAQLADELGTALKQLQQMLAVLGLVRVFEPGGEREGHLQLMVLRCLFARYLVAPRVRDKLPIHGCLLRSMLEGALQAVGLHYRVSENCQGMLRTDECILTLSPGAK